MGSNRAERWRALLALAMLLALCAWAFAPALSGGFLDWDDRDNLLAHTRWRGLGLDELRWMFGTLHLGPYQPLTWLSWALDFELWGLDARAFHATNLALHALASVLLFGSARALLARRWPQAVHRAAVDLGACAAAALFALHPLRVESVCWITERRDVLAGALLVGSLRAWIAWTAPSARRRWYWIALALYVASLLAKASALGWPLVLFALDLRVLRRGPWRTLAREQLAFLAPALLLAGVALAGQGALPGAMASWREHGLAARAAQSAYGWCFYLAQTGIAAGVRPLYDLVLPLDPGEPRFLAALVLAPLALLLAWRARRRWPALWTGLLAYTLLAAPLLGFAQTGPQLVAARYSYQPSLALALLFGAGVTTLASSPARRAGLAALLFALVLSWSSISRSDARHWRSDEELWTHALELDPGSRGAARNAIAAACSASRALAPAERRAVLERALALSRRAPQAERDPELLNARAGVLAALAELDPLRGDECNQQALEALRQALELARHAGSDPTTPEQNLATLLLRLGRGAESVPLLEDWTRRSPGDPEAWAALGHALTELGRAEPARTALERALGLDPELSGARLDRGLLRVALGEAAAAREDFLGVLRALEARLGPEQAALHPDALEARAQLARLGRPSPAR